MNFPTLSIGISRNNFTEQVIDSTISNQTDGGYKFTRPLNTRLLHQWEIMFELITQVDRDTMDDFICNQAKGSSVIFVFTHPVTKNEINVRFLSFDKFVYRGCDNLGQGLYDFQCVLEEV